MLQQTQVATVVTYYERFLAEFPNVSALAAADEQRVLKLWEGLGYYRRARQLHAAARKIVAQHGGRFPLTYAAVRELPGIGRYTAGAILSIGAGQRLPILEANTIRVLSRLSAFRGAAGTASGQQHLWSLAEAILPPKDVGEFNQALMELGSAICTPRKPACGHCPVAAHCLARMHGLVEVIPAAPRPMRYEDVAEVAVIVRHGPRVLVRQRQPSERWAGLWDFPRMSGKLADAAQSVRQLTGIDCVLGRHLTTLKHGVTRFRITLACYEARRAAGANGAAKRGRSPVGQHVRWVTPEELADLPLSMTGRKIALLLAEQVKLRKSPAAALRRGRSRRSSS